MGGKARILKVRLAPAAFRDLDVIWEWNADKNGQAWADGYLSFLKKELEKLGENPSVGQAVESRPGLRYLVIKKRGKGYGHVAIFRVMAEHIEVIRVFHTAQDWSSRLKGG